MVDGFVPKFRAKEGRMMYSNRTVRFWKNKETGTVVEIRRAMLVKPENKLRLVYYDETADVELSCFYEQMVKTHEPISNMRA